MPNCSECDKPFSTDGALCQHYLAKHRQHLCVYCHATFFQQNSLDQHCSAKHGTTGSTAGSKKPKSRNYQYQEEHSHYDPFDGASGYWIERSRFSGKKSFGCFECGECGKEWKSAHAYKIYKQGCQACEEETLPCCLWVNHDTDRRIRRDDSDDDEDGPHDSARCEACRHGDCKRGSSYGGY